MMEQRGAEFVEGGLEVSGEIDGGASLPLGWEGNEHLRDGIGELAEGVAVLGSAGAEFEGDAVVAFTGEDGGLDLGENVIGRSCAEQLDRHDAAAVGAGRAQPMYVDKGLHLPLAIVAFEETGRQHGDENSRVRHGGHELLVPDVTRLKACLIEEGVDVGGGEAIDFGDEIVLKHADPGEVARAVADEQIVSMSVLVTGDQAPYYIERLGRAYYPASAIVHEDGQRDEKLTKPNCPATWGGFPRDFCASLARDPGPASL